MKILITGSAGFIGFHLTNYLLDNEIFNDKNLKIIGVDNINNYYDVNLKYKRLKILKKKNNFKFYKISLEDKKIENIFKKYKFDIVINLAAQAGVRYSITNPESYFKSNLSGFFNILEFSKKYKIKHLIFASTSSVYGNTKAYPLKEESNTDKPLSFYAATKKSNEVLAYSYSNIFKLPITCLRFFTVYGPYGRPDMFLFKYVDAALNNKKIEIYNYGNHVRDFTYIDDVILSISKLIAKVPKKNIPYEIFNIGSNNPIPLKKFINEINLVLQNKPKIKNVKLQKGDIHKTHSDTTKLNKKIKFYPKTNFKIGIRKFIAWYLNEYKK